MTAADWIELWQRTGVTLHAVIDRATDDDRWPWGNDPEAEVIEVDALCALLDRDPARVHARDARGRSLLHVILDQLGHVDEDAPEAGERLLARLFEHCLAHGADPDVSDDDGHSPLFCAPRARWVHRLVEVGADPNATASSGATALMLVIQSAELVGALLACGADPARRDPKGRTAADWARSFEAADSLALLEAAER